MATKTDMSAQKLRRQKIILVVGGVVFLALAAIQGPKLWKQLNPPAPVAAAPATTETTPATTTPTGQTSPTPTTVAPGGSAVLAGVPVPTAQAPTAEEDQLWSFSRFEPKDPFEQQVVPETEPSGGGAPGVAPAKQPKQPQGAGDQAVPGGVAVGGAPPSGPTTDAVPSNATIAVNGKIEKLELKDVFPKADKTFVLVGLTQAAARIGVAGGSFTKGKTVTVRLGRQLTLVDTATGARYVVKLLYSGAGPEQTASFTDGSSSK